MGRYISYSLIGLSVFIILAGFTYASDTVITNTTYTTGSSIVVNSTTYSVTVSSGNATGVMLKKGNESIVFTLGECKEFYDELVCYVSKSSSRALITVFNQHALVTLKRDVPSEKEIGVGFSLTVNVTINNTGRTTAYGVQFKDTIPPGFIIEDTYICSHENGEITWRGDISSKDFIECTYSLYSQELSQGDIVGNLTYTTLRMQKNVTLEDVTIKSYLPDWISVELAADEVSLGQTFNLNINITANVTQNISLEPLKIPLEKNFLLYETSYARLKTHPDSIFLSQKVKSNTSLILDFNITAINNGTHPLAIDVIYTDNDGDEIRFVINKSIKVDLQQLTVEIMHEPDTVLEPFVEHHYVVFVTNPNPYFEISHYDVKIQTDLVGFDTDFRKIDVTNSHIKKNVFDTYYSLLEINESGNHTIKFSVVGSDTLETKLYGGKTLSLNSFPLGKISLIKGINFSTRDGVNITEVKVFVKSSYSRKIEDIIVEDSLPDVFFYKGPLSKTIDLEPNKLVEVYSYELSLPPDFQGENSMLINTSARYTYAGKKFLESQQISADPTRILEHNFNTRKNPSGVIVEEVIEVSDSTKPGEQMISKSMIFVLFIIFDIILIIVFISYLNGMSVMRLTRRIFIGTMAKIRHVTISRKSDKLNQKIAEISTQESNLKLEKNKVESLISNLEKELRKEDRRTPKEIEIIEKQKKKLANVYGKLDSKKHIYDEKIARIQSKEQVITAKQAEIRQLMDHLSQLQQENAGKKEKMSVEIENFKNKLIQLHDSLNNMENSKDHAVQKIGEINKSELDILLSRIESIEDARKKARDKDEELGEEQKKLIKERSMLRRFLKVMPGKSETPSQKKEPEQPLQPPREPVKEENK